MPHFTIGAQNYGGMDAALMSEMKAKIIGMIDEGIEKNDYLSDVKGKYFWMREKAKRL